MYIHSSYIRDGAQARFYAETDIYRSGDARREYGSSCRCDRLLSLGVSGGLIRQILGAVHLTVRRAAARFNFYAHTVVALSFSPHVPVRFNCGLIPVALLN